jgi:hypothetical protein
MTYGIFCTVSGGATGSRSAWLKTGENSKIATFPTLEAAEARAQELLASRSPYSTAYFAYRPALLTGEGTQDHDKA